MKHLILALLVVALSACMPKSDDTRSNGGEREGDGGTSTDVGDGGNTRPSSEEDILLAISALQSRVKVAFAQLRASSSVIEDQKVLEILNVMWTPQGEELIDIEKDILSTQYLSMVNEKCPHQTTGHEDASTIRGRLKSAICFNVNSLKRLSKDALKLELLALAAHEHAHHFGFGEEEANILQNFFLGDKGNWIVQDNVVREGLVKSASEFFGDTKKLQDEAFKYEDRDERILCSRMGSTTKIAERLAELAYLGFKYGDKYDIVLTKETFQKSGLLYTLMVSANDYCLGTNTQPPQDYPLVQKGNIKELRIRLDIVVTIALELKVEIDKALGLQAELSNKP